MYDYYISREQTRKRTRRRRFLLVGIIVLLILAVNLAVLASMDYPELSIHSMSVDRIDIPSNTLYVGMTLAVNNDNRVDAYLSGVEGEVTSGGVLLDTFSFDEVVVIPPFTNMTVRFEVVVSDAPLPLDHPVLRVEGRARVRAWIQGITYHFTHTIPLTHSPDQDNLAPVADIDSPRWARRDRPATFDGSNSYDPDGKVVGWTWEFGDGHRASGPKVEHSFLTPGEYEVTLTVVDQMGERGRTSVSIRVLPL